jgi:oxalate decarboxylase/phosphoglucose isomerase-like protein (cupin superfamily)
VYVVSGQLEAFHDGTCRVLAPGETVLMKAGQPHAYRNWGDEDLHVLAFFAAPGGEIDGEDLPMPEAISGLSCPLDVAQQRVFCAAACIVL